MSNSFVFSKTLPLNSIVNPETLPKDCINLFDKTQTDYYKNNSIVKKTLELLSLKEQVDTRNTGSSYIPNRDLGNNVVDVCIVDIFKFCPID